MDLDHLGTEAFRACKERPGAVVERVAVACDID